MSSGEMQNLGFGLQWSELPRQKGHRKFYSGKCGTEIQICTLLLETFIAMAISVNMIIYLFFLLELLSVMKKLSWQNRKKSRYCLLCITWSFPLDYLPFFHT